MEFNVITDLSVLPKEIEFNFEELKNEIAPKLDYYNNLVVTESGIKEAKSDKANLNKLRTAIEDKRKEVKKQCLAPYEAFEKQCKEIVAMIDAPIYAIDSQIKAFEEIVKKQKYAELEEHFASIDKPEFIKLENVLNPKWANISMKTVSLKQEISNNVQCIISDYDEICRMYENFPLLMPIKNKFTETLDKSQTLVYAATLERQYQQQEQMKKAKETENSILKTSSESIKATENVIHEPVLSGLFKVTCTKSQLIALREFMKENNINFEVVK